jgi:hypothetical protein
MYSKQKIMNKTINTSTSLLLVMMLFAFGNLAQTQTCNSQYTKYNYRLSPPSVNAAPYDLELHIGTNDQGESLLIASVVLGEMSYFVSPYSSHKAMGSFKVLMTENKHISMDSNYVEIPQSIASDDPHSEGKTHFVHENTVYLKDLVIMDTNDFEVQGQIQFVIEPKCTLEKIDFTLIQKDHALSIETNKEGC